MGFMYVWFSHARFLPSKMSGLSPSPYSSKHASLANPNMHGYGGGVGGYLVCMTNWSNKVSNVSLFIVKCKWQEVTAQAAVNSEIKHQSLHAEYTHIFYSLYDLVSGIHNMPHVLHEWTSSTFIRSPSK